MGENDTTKSMILRFSLDKIFLNFLRSIHAA